MRMNFKEENGQVIVILLLIIVVALGVGLSAVGRSISEISTSSKTEDSSRAFSAAEAGIEKAFVSSGDFGQAGGGTSFGLSNQTSASVNWNPSQPSSGQALEHPPIYKKDVAQFWLADPLSSPPLASKYTQGDFNLYFGANVDYTSNPNDKPAVEVTVVLRSTLNTHYQKKYLYDSYTPTRNTDFAGCAGTRDQSVNTQKGNGRLFYCRVNVSGYKTNASDVPIMARVRLLYTSTSHSVAVQPTGGGSLPPQVRTFTSTGNSGNVQRTLEVFQQKDVMPQAFDYGLFSASDLSK